MDGFIRSASLTNYGEVARGVGLDPVRLLKDYGLPPDALTDPDLMIPIDSVRQLLEASAERSGVAGFGLLMAQARRLSNLGALGLLMREQPTVRAAVESYVHYARAFNEALFLTLEETGDVVVLREELIIGRGSAVRQSTELAIGVSFGMLRALLGPDWRPRRVCFAHGAPADLSIHHRFFGRHVTFGQVFNGIVCARTDLDRPNAGADPAMARYATKLLEDGPSESGERVRNHVRQFVVMNLASRRCTIERVAGQLGVDRRTLHRRLAREGTSFSAIVEELRREYVMRYMQESNRSLTEISTMLGFGAQSAFSRWYRRQFKRSASSVRRTETERG
ncbi:MAG TPA: AraC family transcriptional regulator [Usitatibacter sp.]|jgi:AraC-like DNA-binding protein|nr:AraC family transcriptional regulator [Usitatibacter sp.]